MRHCLNKINRQIDRQAGRQADRIKETREMVQQEKPNNMSSVLKRPTQERVGTNDPKLSCDLQVAQKCTHAYAHTHACAHLPHHEKKNS